MHRHVWCGDTFYHWNASSLLKLRRNYSGCQNCHQNQRNFINIVCIVSVSLCFICLSVCLSVCLVYCLCLCVCQPGVPAVTVPQPASALQVLKERADEIGVKQDSVCSTIYLCGQVYSYRPVTVTVDLTSIVRIVNGNRNRNKNYLISFTEIGMKHRNYFEHGNWIEIENVIWVQNYD